MKKSSLLMLAFVVLTAAHPFCEEIKKIENFIWSIHAFDGRIYKNTFCREDSKEIFLLANADNFISPRITFIYYFPAMEGYRLDTDIVNYPYPGVLVISGNGIKKTFTSVVYTYTNIPEQKATDQSSGFSQSGEQVANGSDEVLRVYQGADAEKVRKRYDTMIEEYRVSLEQWEKHAREFQVWQNEMVKKIREAHAAGKDVSGLVSEVQSRSSGFPPQRPSYQIEPLVEAFIVNLPVGEYDMLLKDPEGYIVEGSEKKLFVFKEKRHAGICYQYASADKISKPTVSQAANSVIYTDGTNDLYFEGYYQDEYNDYFHNKLEINDSQGSVFRTKSVIGEKVRDSWLETYSSAGKKDIILEELYYIRTDNSKNTGYSIVIWDGRPGQPMQYTKPHFGGFYLPMSSVGNRMTIELRNINDRVYDGSEREVRVIKQTWLINIILVLSLIPIGLMIRMLIRRRSLYSKI